MTSDADPDETDSVKPGPFEPSAEGVEGEIHPFGPDLPLGSESTFRRLAALSSDWYWRQDASFCFTHFYVSTEAESLAGYKPSISMGRRRWELPDVEPITSSWEAHRAVLDAHERFRDFEYRRPEPDGSVSFVSISGEPIFDRDGRFIGYQGVGRNITERKVIEEALRESESRFRSLAALSSDWYWRQDAELRFTYLSREVQALAGYSADSSLGKCRWELPDVLPLTSSWSEHRAVLEARQKFHDFEYARVDASGEDRYISVSGEPVFDRDGRFVGYQGVARNVTERRRIENALRSRQEVLDLAQKVASAAAFDWQASDAVAARYWSDEFVALHGLPPGPMAATVRNFKRLVASTDWPRVKDELRRATSTGELATEYRVALSDGATRWLQAKGRFFFDELKRPVRVVGFVVDVTQRKHAEDDVRQLERRLRQAQRLQAMGTLAGGIAHDFNNILGVILGYGEMALQAASKRSRLRRNLENIVAAGERGRTLIDRILVFSRTDGSRRQPVHVEEIVSEVLNLVQSRAGALVEIERHLRAGRAAVLSEAAQIHQLAMNLATNAVQAMLDGGRLVVTLDIERVEEARILTTGGLEAGEYVVLTVSDTGIGIAKQIFDRVFDPFFTTKDVGAGTGLGLSVVHGVVAEAGGAIDVVSEAGKGSRFTVYLPRSGDADIVDAVASRDLPLGSGQHVLVVDDEVQLARLVAENLESLGYVATAFTSSKAALAAFESAPHAYDLVLADEKMPDMTGSALLRNLRPRRPGLPAILMTGYVDRDLGELAAASHVVEVLKKPVRLRDLAMCLERAFGTVAKG